LKGKKETLFLRHLHQNENKKMMINLQLAENPIYEFEQAELLRNELCFSKKGVYSATNDPAEPIQNPAFMEELHFQVPAFLSKVLWQKHGYSPRDVERTLSSCLPVHLWHLVLVEGLCLTNSRKSQTGARSGSALGGKNIILSRLLAHYMKLGILSDLDVIRNQDNALFPCLPFHVIPENIFELASAEAYVHIRSLEENYFCYKHLFVWQNCNYVPILGSKSRLMMKRVVPISVFTEFYGKTGLSPTIVNFKQQQFAMLEEAFYVSGPVQDPGPA